MQIAHPCNACGTDLARTPARLDRAYEMLIVRCPACGRAAVRERHPLHRIWRAFRHLDAAVSVLVLNTVAAVGLLAATVAGAFWLRRAVDRPFAALWHDEPIEIVAVLLVVPLGVGAWLTFGLSHWRRRTSWLTFFGAAVAIVLVAGAIELIARTGFFDEFFAISRRWRTTYPMSWQLLRETLRSAGEVTVALLVMMLIAILGHGPGLALRSLLHYGVRSVRRMRRRRRRRERMR